MIESAKKCPECGVKDLFLNKDKGEIICRECGFVVEENGIDFGKEWTEHDEHDSCKRRSGAPITFSQPEITTQVGSKGDLAKIDSKERYKFMRLNKWQRRSYNSIEQNLNHALTDLKTAASALHLPKSAEEETARLYTEILRKGLVKGRGIERLIAGCIFIACKTYGIPKTLADISKATQINIKELSKSYKFIARTLNIKLIPTSPVNYVQKFASELKLSPKTQTQAIKLIEQAQKKQIITGKNPSSIAISTLYLSALMNKEKKTQNEMSKVSGISDVTLRQRCKELVEKLRIKSKLNI